MTTYIADPARDAVLMRTRFEGPAADQVYVRLEPLAGGTGGGGTRTPAQHRQAGQPPRRSVPVAFNTNTVTQAINRDYAVPTFEALSPRAGSRPRASATPAASSDGLSCSTPITR